MVHLTLGVRLLPLREKVPEGRMRGCGQSPRLLLPAGGGGGGGRAAAGRPPPPPHAPVLERSHSGCFA